MRINDVVTEDTESSNDYQRMQAFVRSNNVPGVPPDQQVALALFKELQKQKQQNQQLSAELGAAEERIDVATQSGKLSSQELGKHRSELDRERKNIEKQQSAMGQLDQQYAQRTQASQEQISDLTNKLEMIKNKPGVDEAKADALEKKIQELSKNGVSASKVKELEQSILNVQNMQQVDDGVMKELLDQVSAAQVTAKELETTKQSLGKDIEAQIAHFKDVEKTVAGLRNELDALGTSYEETDATVFDLENDVHRLQTVIAAKNAAGNASQMVKPGAPGATSMQRKEPANQPKYTPQQIAIAKKLGLSGDLQNPNFQSVAESAFDRSIAWAIGKTK